MSVNHRIEQAFLVLLYMWILFVIPIPTHAQDRDSVLLFSYFVNNGEDGLHLATSDDGLHWTPLRGGMSFLAPKVGESKLMRDPHLLLGPDSLFRMVWTTSWSGHTIGYASSRDLINWSDQKALPVMTHEPTAKNCWAPEVVYDAFKKHYVIFWSSTVPGHNFPGLDTTGSSPNKGHRIYYTTTKDFESFSPTRLLYDPGFNVIDATLAKNGNSWLMFIKNETKVPEPVKTILFVRAQSPEGPFTEPSGPIHGPYWAEGPSAIKMGDWWYVYFDKYRDKQYGLVRSKDMEHWEDISEQLKTPPGVPRHGTVLRVHRSVVFPFLVVPP